MKKFKLKNIDCALCAEKIEKKLASLTPQSQVTVNPITSILTIEYADEKKLQELITSIEPGVEVQEVKYELPFMKSFFLETKKEFIIIIFAGLLLLLGIVFGKQLASTPFSIAEYLVFISAYFISGKSVLIKAVKNIFHGKIFDENFLMTIATFGAIAIHQLPEAVTVMLFYNIGEYFQGLSVRRSRDSIKSLLQLKVEYANIISNGEIKKISPLEVKVNDIILIKPGEKIPLDGIVVEGNSTVNTYSLTGETIPLSVSPNIVVLAGFINNNAAFKVRVQKLFSESSAARILELTESAVTRKAESEKFITSFARYYTPIVVIVALFIAFIPAMIYSTENIEDWIYRALVLLVISCPCALVISIPLGYFVGIGSASLKGILIKGSNYLDALNKVKKIIFDKTGTLTKGVFKVSGIKSFNGFSESELLKFAAYAEFNSNHPTAAPILEAFGKKIELNSSIVHKETPGKGIVCTFDNTEVIAGNDPLLHEEGIEHPVCEVEGTVIHVAVNKKYAGYITISDQLKDNAMDSIESLRDCGIKEIKMFTGDNDFSARYISNMLKLDGYIANLLPDQKLAEFEKIVDQKKSDGKIAFVGEGINDAPVLARADVGIAMGALGSDAAIEAADIVIMTDSLSKIPEAIRIAKRTRQIVWQNIFFAFSVKLFFILLGLFGEASMWEAVFADMGVALLAIFNATRLLR